MANGIDVYRETEGVYLPPTVTSEIWAQAQEESAIMSLAQGTVLPGSGVSIPIITSDPQAYWVDETDEVTASTPGFSNKVMEPYMLSILMPVSNQFMRDADALYNEVVRRAPGVIAQKFDSTCFGMCEAPGDKFDTLGNCVAVDVETDPWGGLVTADAAVSAAGGLLGGWIIAPQAKAIFLTAKDGNDRPLFVNSLTAEGSVPNLMGQPTHLRKAAYAAGKAATQAAAGTAPTLGFAGDWTMARYGTVEGIKMAIADQATITVGEAQINLFQRHMTAVRFDFEVGFVTRGDGYFTKLVGAPRPQLVSG